jgi:hypothetical protein
MIAADMNTDTDHDQRGGVHGLQVDIIDQDDPDPDSVHDLVVVDIKIFLL